MPLTHLVDLYRKSIGYPRWHGRILRCTEDGSVALEQNQARAWVEQVAASLVARGTNRGDRIAIWCEPRPEALIAEFAAAMIGAAVVPMDPAWSTEDASRVLNDADPALIFVSARTLSSHEHGQVEFKEGSVIVIQDSVNVPPPVPAYTWTQFLTIGHDVDALTARVVRQRSTATKLDDLAVLTYRFDERGTPLGVMQSFGNIAAGIENAIQTFEIGSRETVFVSREWPDIAQRVLLYSVIFKGGEIAFPPADPLAAAAAQRVARPTILLQDPRTIGRDIVAFGEAHATSKRRNAQLAQAYRVAARRQQIVENGGRMPLRHRISYWLSNRSVFKKLKSHLGGRVRLIIIGAEAVAGEDMTLLTTVGVTVWSVLGWPETTWLVAANKPLTATNATWDRIPPRIEFRSRYDGALCVRGSNVTSGYWRRPELTAVVMDHRWFSTGISGWLYDDGALRTEGADLDDVGEARLVA